METSNHKSEITIQRNRSFDLSIKKQKIAKNDHKFSAIKVTSSHWPFSPSSPKLKIWNSPYYSYIWEVLIGRFWCFRLINDFICISNRSSVPACSFVQLLVQYKSQLCWLCAQFFSVKGSWTLAIWLPDVPLLPPVPSVETPVWCTKVPPNIS